MKIGRNASCPCGSGKKYKKCCLGKEDIELDIGKEDIFLDEPIPDYGSPDITDDFFNNKFPELPTAAALQHFRMSHDNVDDIIGNVLDSVLSEERKNKIKEEKNQIERIDNPDEALYLMGQKIEGANEKLLINKLLEYADHIIPKMIAKLGNNTNDFFVEFGIKLIKEADDNSYSGQILKILPSIKHAYTLSTVCLLLGFIGNKEAIKPLWDIYNLFKEKYPDESFDQGPLFALSELKERGLI